MPYYYSRLPPDMQEEYLHILDSIRRMQDVVCLKGRYSKDNIEILVSAVNRDHAELFWWESSTYYISSGKIHPKLYFTYDTISHKEIKARCDKLTEWKKTVTKAIKEKEGKHPLKTVDKVWLLGNHLASRMRYSNEGTIPFRDRHSIWGAYTGAGVCEAIAKSFHFIVSDNPVLGLNGIYVEGYQHEDDEAAEGKNNHAWNAIVDEKGYCYHLDLTGQIHLAHIPFHTASRHIFLLPDQMEKQYRFADTPDSLLYVPPTCHRLEEATKEMKQNCDFY